MSHLILPTSTHSVEFYEHLVTPNSLRSSKQSSVIPWPAHCCIQRCHPVLPGTQMRWSGTDGKNVLHMAVSLSFPPNAGEKYYARLILSVVRDLRSFDDLGTFEGVLHPTIRDACHARGLLDDDLDLERCLDEAIHLRTGTSLRSMFLSILLHSSPARPLLLWEKYKSHLCDDLQRTLSRKGIDHPSMEHAIDYGLDLLESELAADGTRTLQDLGLPASQNNWNTLLGNQFHLEERSYDPQCELRCLLSCLPKLNTEQHHAFNTILNSVSHHRPRIFFV